MRTYDLTPLMRSTIGFDRLTRALDSAMRIDDSALAYPPYNIEKVADDDYRIVMAVAGFSEADLEIEAAEGWLVIRGKMNGDTEGKTFLHRGIAGRAFERKFQLADHIQVTGAGLENGLLTVELIRVVPEAHRPRQIEIKTAAALAGPVLDQPADAGKAA